MVYKDHEYWKAEYQKSYNVYEKFELQLKSLIKNIISEYEDEILPIESRTKSIDSFVKKILKKDYQNPLTDITDLVGIRIITYYRDIVEKIGKIIRKEFDIDHENSIDKSELLDPDRFGYLSVHYVVSLSPQRKQLTEWNEFQSFKAEIQIRTILQHSWAAINHKIIYNKKEDIPKRFSRKFSRLSALLELADEEFLSIRDLKNETEENYLKKIERGNLNIDLDLSSLSSYFNSTKKHLKWTKIAQEIGFKPIKILDEKNKNLEWNGTLLNTLIQCNITTIKEFDRLLNEFEKDNQTREVLVRFYDKVKKPSATLTAVPQYIILILILYFKRKQIEPKAIRKTGFSNSLQKLILDFLKD